MRLLVLFICIVLGLLFLSAPAFASDNAFSVTGQVIDRYGNPVMGANVTLLDNNFKVIGERVTNEAGSYDFVNVLSDTGTVTLRVNFTKDGKSYAVPAYYTRYYPAKGIQMVPAGETQLPGYPEPVFGYVYGAIKTDTSSNGRPIDGVVYLIGPDDVKYYQFADKADGKASFQFYVPPGTYVLYAQHRENGLVFESAHTQVTAGRNTEPTDSGVVPTQIIISLNSPTSAPDPKYLPEHQGNMVNGTVLNAAGRPLQDLKVTLFQRSDNMTTFVPMIGTDGKPVTRTTDYNGYYEFYGVVPTTDDGKAIQTKKDIKVMAEYTFAGNPTLNAASDEKALYYPDMIMGYGKETGARNIVFSPMKMNVESVNVPASPVPASAEPSSIAVMPLLAALVIGLVCLGGMYWFLNGKGR